VLFPAHNENRDVIRAVSAAYPELLLLDWKYEIDALAVEKGLSKWDFCVDDAHDHSTESAGYVGAAMIYRALYNEMPNARLSMTVSQAYIDALLGDYVTTGYVTKTLYGVHYFK
jgi:hypothetical protein